MQLLRYLWQRLRHPRWVDFLDMGVGIEARANRCAKFWKNHLELSKSFQLRALQDRESWNGLAVLGAGRLLDVPIDALARKSAFVLVVDRDPSAAHVWKRATRAIPARFECRLADLTTCIDSWTSQMDGLVARERDLEALADRLAMLEPPPPLDLASPVEAIVSTNVLGQLGIYWRDRVISRLQHHGHLEHGETVAIPKQLGDVISKQIAQLENQHLRTLESQGATRIVLISDIRFFSYDRERPEWDASDALTIPTPPSLAGYERTDHDSWLWHLAPQGIENPDHGEIHEVHAWSFDRKPD